MIRELEEGAAQLNAKTDALKRKADVIHAAIKAANVGIEVWFTFRSDATGRYDLGYAKVENRWGIAIRESGQSPDESWEWQFANAPRLLRVEAATHIDQLIDALLTTIATADTQTDEALLAMDRALTRLQKLGGPDQ